MTKRTVVFGSVATVTVFAVLAVGIECVSPLSPNEARETKEVAKPIRIEPLVWKFDSSEGLAITYPVCVCQQPATTDQGDVTLVAKVSDELTDDWEVLEAHGFTCEGCDRNRTLTEGPYPYRNPKSDECSCRSRQKWEMVGMQQGRYEIDLLLHRKNDRISFKDTVAAIQKRNGIEFRTE